MSHVENWQAQWSFPLGVAYLNHGSFGPSPRRVREAAGRFREELAANPMEFYCRRLDQYLLEARTKLAAFTGTVPENLIFVDNATAGMNLVAGAVALAPGDEVLANDHEYGAVLRIWERACQKAGARLIVARLPTPISCTQEVLDPLFASASARTKMLVASHVTSPTAIVMPIEAICREARRRGLVIVVDGPHAPGMVPIDLEPIRKPSPLAGEGRVREKSLDRSLDRLDCDYYTASCHKWLSAPFGSGFLYVHPRAQRRIEPLVQSWGRTPSGARGTWQAEFDWAGTRDPAPWLAIPSAINFLDRVGIDEFRDATHRLAHYARDAITKLIGLEPLVPDSHEWYGSMISLPLPDGDGPALQKALWQQHGIEVPIMEWRGQRLLRVSCHLYNRPEDIDRLVTALGQLLS